MHAMIAFDFRQYTLSSLSKCLNLFLAKYSSNRLFHDLGACFRPCNARLSFCLANPSRRPSLQANRSSSMISIASLEFAGSSIDHQCVFSYAFVILLVHSFTNTVGRVALMTYIFSEVFLFQILDVYKLSFIVCHSNFSYLRYASLILIKLNIPADKDFLFSDHTTCMPCTPLVIR